MLKRASLQTQTLEVIAKSAFAKGGYLGIAYAGVNDDWLLLYDQTKARPAEWRLRAISLQNLREQTLGEFVDVDLQTVTRFLQVPDVGLSGDWVVLAQLAIDKSLPCKNTTTLEIRNLRTGEQRTLDERCTTDYLWFAPKISGDNVIVEQDFPDAKGGGNRVVLFNLQTNTMTPLTDIGHSEPRISNVYAIWKNARRFDYAKQVGIYNLHDKHIQVLTLPDIAPKAYVNESFVYWWPSPLQPLYAYNADQQELIQVATPASGEGFWLINMYGNMIVWQRDPNATGIPEHTFIEWRELPK